MIVVLGLVGILAMLIVLMGARSKAEALRKSCESNLTQVGKAMSMYADSPAHGSFPNYAENKEEPFTADPLLSWGLLYNKYVADPRVFSCPSNPMPPITVSTWSPAGNRPPNPVRATYAYDPGHSPSDALTAVAADMKGAGEGSDNHGSGAGQNVLRANGVVGFQETVVNPLAKGQDSNIYSLNPELSRNEDSFIRQK
jgi:hypothetical protein